MGGLSFSTPWLLAALALLPGLWWLIRALPPPPKRLAFPPIRLLARLEDQESPPQKTPWWLLLLRLSLAALLILALAGPRHDPARDIGAGGATALIIVDNGWTAAPNWAASHQSVEDLVARLSGNGQPLLLTASAAPAGGWPVAAEVNALALLAPTEAAAKARALTPRPWPADPAQLRDWLTRQPPTTPLQSFIVSDGFTSAAWPALIDHLRGLGPVTLLAPEAPPQPLAFTSVVLEGGDFRINLARPPGLPAMVATVNAVGRQGAIYGSASIAFARGQPLASLRLSLPPPARQAVTRLQIVGQNQAGAVYLLDDFSARPMVGLAEVETSAQAQPLTQASFYLQRALAPYASLSQGPAADLAGSGVNVILMPDTGHLDPGTTQALRQWVEAGGALIRFAGPKLAAAQLQPQGNRQDAAAETLLPVPLRPGQRALGGAISWQSQQRLARFAASSPLAGLAVPDDVTIARQVLAEPGSGLEQKSWALLEDGTPLITGAALGAGHLVLFHTSADAEWSNLVLSGSFVEILRRLLALGRPSAEAGRAGGNGDGADSLYSARQHLSGFGVLTPVESGPRALPGQMFRQQAGAKLPPGLYEDDAGIVHAVNLARRAGPIGPGFRFRLLEGLPDDVRLLRQGIGGVVDLTAPLLTLGLALAVIDLIVSFWMRSLLPRLPWPRRAAGLALMMGVGAALLGLPRPAMALDERQALELSSAVRLACLESGDQGVDRQCLDGLRGLSGILRVRTAALAGEPVMVRPDDDILGFFPLLYWPVLADAPPLSADAATALKAYLRQHGLILFDTGMAGGGDGQAAQPVLERIARSLDLAPWERLGPDHVLSHSFYILRGDTGARGDATVWIDRGTQGESGKVSSVVVGAGDWASAWAVAPAGALLGAPARDRQAEMALRFGVNLVLYALTGTYKADQVHVPALLERMER